MGLEHEETQLDIGAVSRITLRPLPRQPHMHKLTRTPPSASERRQKTGSRVRRIHQLAVGGIRHEQGTGRNCQACCADGGERGCGRLSQVYLFVDCVINNL